MTTCWTTNRSSWRLALLAFGKATARIGLSSEGMASQDFDDQLTQALNRRAAEHTRRFLSVYQPIEGGKYLVDPDGHRCLNLASNDYLGLAHDPRLAQAIAQAAEQHGAGSGASRLVCGTHPVHEHCEQAFTQAKYPHGTSEFASLLLPTGYMANLAVVTALADESDLIVIDKLVHASLIDAARTSQATVRSYPHLNLKRLDDLLAQHGTNARRRFIVTDSVFSMDGDCADLSSLCELADKHNAVLVVDEAHGTGVLGPTGAGLAELDGVQDRIDITVSTCSKALGCQGGVITAKQTVIDTLINQARPLIYTTGVMPTQAAAARCALTIAQQETARRQQVIALATRLRNHLTTTGWQLPPTRHVTPIIPLIVGSNDKALSLAEHLKTNGILGVAIRPPTVSPGASRVRLTVRADLSKQDLGYVIDAVNIWRTQNS